MFFLTQCTFAWRQSGGGLQNPDCGVLKRQVPCLIHHTFTCRDDLSPEVPSHFIYKESHVKAPLPQVCQASPHPEIWVEAEGVTGHLWFPGWIFCQVLALFHVSVTQQWLQSTNSFKLKHTPMAGQVLTMFMFFKKWGFVVFILFLNKFTPEVNNSFLIVL